MFRKLRPRSLYDVLAALGFFLALATSTAYAANTVFSADIVDGEVKAVDIGAGAVTNVKLADGAVGKPKISAGAVENGKIADGAVGQSKLANGAATNAKIADGAVSSAKVQNDAVAGVDVNEASLDGGAIPGTTARAYGAVEGDGDMSRSKNVVGNATGLDPLDPPTEGAYCIELDSSIDADNAVLIAVSDYSLNSTSGPVLTWAQARSDIEACEGPNAIAVRTGRFTAAGGTVFENQAFFFAVP